MEICNVLTVWERPDAAFYMAQRERSQITLQAPGIKDKIRSRPPPGDNAGASLKRALTAELSLAMPPYYI